MHTNSIMWRHNIMNVSLCIWFLLTLSLSAVECETRYSQPFDSKDGFIPIHLNTNGQIRQFSKDEHQSVTIEDNLMNQSNTNPVPNPIQIEDSSSNSTDTDEDDVIVNEFFMEIKNLQEYFFNFFDNILSTDSDSYEIASGVRIEAVNNTRNSSLPDVQSRSLKDGVPSQDLFMTNLRNFVDRYDLRVNMPRAMESGRLFFFSGLKKIMWPIFVGIQILKTMLLAMLLPSLIGSLGKIVGKGLTQVSGFNRPSEAVENLEFKDNSINFDDDNKFAINTDYNYRPEASTQNLATQMYNVMNNNGLSRFGTDKDAMMMTAYSNKNSLNKLMSNGAANTDKFKVFQNVPASSLLLSNYDPFYSPLLSRLDSVFHQLGLGTGNEVCREKVVCLMYANPAKYAPYSNLVSAQLSRELNELRKPTSDNPEILRFFKYMRSAKDGQDGVDCDNAYKSCQDFKDSDNPAMITTYHDINKLVQARKFI